MILKYGKYLDDNGVYSYNGKFPFLNSAKKRIIEMATASEPFSTESLARKALMEGINVATISRDFGYTVTQMEGLAQKNQIDILTFGEQLLRVFKTYEFIPYTLNDEYSISQVARIYGLTEPEIEHFASLMEDFSNTDIWEDMAKGE